jgi:CheY-like chemotaxis protein
MAEKILVVDDELALQETLAYNLRRQGYEVEIAGDGPAALDSAHSFKPDLILLDVMLPGIDGFELCRILRQDSNIPVLMLTARDDEIDRVVGLEVGADDYMTKPFSMRELMARVKAMLRRVRMIRDEMQSGAQPHPAVGPPTAVGVPPAPRCCAPDCIGVWQLDCRPGAAGSACERPGPGAQTQGIRSALSPRAA